MTIEEMKNIDVPMIDPEAFEDVRGSGKKYPKTYRRQEISTKGR